MNGETKLILDKINDLKEFQIQRHNDLVLSLQELKESDKVQIKESEKYRKNHYAYHKREKKTLVKLILGLGIIAIIISASGLGPLVAPHIISVVKVLPFLKFIF